jgi:hypothetical protein
MATHTKRKVEIVVERPLLGEAVRLIEGAGAKGYTVFPAIAGRGVGGTWESGDVSDAEQTVLILAICDAAVAEKLVAAAGPLIRDFRAIIYTSAVEVVRPERF